MNHTPSFGAPALPAVRIALDETFGAFITARRLHLAIPMRRFCREHGFSGGQYSKLERDLRPAPRRRHHRLRIAQALRLAEGTPEWDRFVLLADRSPQTLRPAPTEEQMRELMPHPMLHPVQPEHFDTLLAQVRHIHTPEPDAPDESLFEEGGAA